MCKKRYGWKKSNFTLLFVAKIEKKRYNDNILPYVLANMLCNLTAKRDAVGNNFYLRVSMVNPMGVFYET